MGAIAGIIRWQSTSGNSLSLKQDVERMLKEMPYRCTDGMAVAATDQGALGQGFFTTWPDAAIASLPASLETGLHLVMDGCVLNSTELRSELTRLGVQAQDADMARLVLLSYQVWGKDCIAKLDGDFALAIFDPTRRILLLARDRSGQKPLFYRWTQAEVAFASDVHALAQGQPELDLVHVADWISNAPVDPERTPCKGYKRLLPGHLLFCEGEKAGVHEYWQPHLLPLLLYKNDRDYVEHYRELLSKVLRQHLQSRFPVAFEVSGGLDSSALYLMALKTEAANTGQFARPFSAFTLDFRGQGDADESFYVQAVQRTSGQPVNYVKPSMPPLDWYEDHASRYLNHPGYSNSAMFLALRTAAKNGGSGVLVSGQGGDEWLAGLGVGSMEAYQLGGISDLFEWLGQAAEKRGWSAALYEFIRHGCFPAMAENHKNALRSLKTRLMPEQASDRIGSLLPALARLARASRLDATRWQTEKYQLLSQRLCHAWLRGAFSSLIRESDERMAAMGGLELRRPFFDRRIMEFAFMTPDRLRCGPDGIDKSIHRKAMNNILPEEILNRKSKAYFDETHNCYKDALAQALNREETQAYVANWVKKQHVPKLMESWNAGRGGVDPAISLMTLVIFSAYANALNVKTCDN